jgi:hypothetical protein
MVLELQPGILRECRGVVKYAPEFAQVWGRLKLLLMVTEIFN